MDSEWQLVNPWMEGRRNGWTYRAMVGADETLSGLVDVHALSPNGKYFVGTVGTLADVQERFEHYQTSGECLDGSYFWCIDLVLVASLDPATLLDVLDHLASEGDLQQAFDSVPSGEWLVLQQGD